MDAVALNRKGPSAEYPFDYIRQGEASFNAVEPITPPEVRLPCHNTTASSPA